MVRVVKDRLFSWSYMMQWYSGWVVLADLRKTTLILFSDIHWFNTVKIPRTTTESYLGPKALESRARNFYILGVSLGLIFDNTDAGGFLKAIMKVLEEWEGMVEGGGKVVSSEHLPFSVCLIDREGSSRVKRAIANPLLADIRDRSITSLH
jgi:hypothetical protein